MTPAERLAFEIEALSDKQQADQDRSKNELYKKVIEMAQSGETAPAQALKQYWQKINSWKVKKKTKKYEKVQEIKSILGESK